MARRAPHGLAFASAVALLLAILAGGLPPALAQTGDDIDDAVILLDVSASMKGGGEDRRAQDIWDIVRDSVAELVSSFRPDTRVMVLPFSNGARVDLSRIFERRPERAAAAEYLRSLDPSGDVTWIYAAGVSALQQLRGWAAGLGQRRQALYIFTDGLDNSSHKDTWVADVGAEIVLHRADFPYLLVGYYDLKHKLPPGGPEELEKGGVRVCQGIVSLADERLRTGAAVLDLGVLDPASGASRVLDLEVRDVPADAHLTLRLDPGGLPLDLLPADAPVATRLELRLRPREAVAPGAHEATVEIVPSLRLCFLGSSRLRLRFSVPRPPEESPRPTPVTPPELRLRSVPAGPDVPMETFGLTFGWPIRIARPSTFDAEVLLRRPGQPDSDQSGTLETWFRREQLPQLRVVVSGQACGPACTREVALTPGVTVRTSLVPAEIVPGGGGILLDAAGDGVLKDGAPWRTAAKLDKPLNAARPRWSVVWDQLYLGYVLPVLAGLLSLLVVSAVYTRYVPAFFPQDHRVYVRQLRVKAADDTEEEAVTGRWQWWAWRLWRPKDASAIVVFSHLLFLFGPPAVRVLSWPRPSEGAGSTGTTMPVAGPRRVSPGGRIPDWQRIRLVVIALSLDILAILLVATGHLLRDRLPGWAAVLLPWLALVALVAAVVLGLWNVRRPLLGLLLFLRGTLVGLDDPVTVGGVQVTVSTSSLPARGTSS